MTNRIVSFSPVDYLVLGHVTQDLGDDGPHLGGTVSYAALTAQALGLSVGIVTACSTDLDMHQLEDIPKSIVIGETSTVFKNTDTSEGRIQHVLSLAPRLDASCVPHAWKNTPLVHLAPVAQEVEPSLVRVFSDSFIGLTIQGWLRQWDKKGEISVSEWPEARFVLEKSNAAVFSLEDIENNEIRIEELVSYISVLVVTEGNLGARVYWNGDLRYFRPPTISDVFDTTGAGDIFATAFFIRLKSTRNPWEAARFATELAALSTQRPGLSGVPTVDEINHSLMEILRDY